MFDEIFLAHPRSVGESYGRHLTVAWGFSFRLIGAGLACLIHGLAPSLFRSTASAEVRRLHEQMCVNRGAVSQAWREGR